MENKLKAKIKNLLKKTPVIYPMWHNMRVKNGERREKNKKASFDKYGMEILGDVMKMVQEKGYSCFCEAGTLLGIVRDGGLIPWDDDLDLWIQVVNDFSWERFEKDMQGIGFWKYRTIKMDGEITCQSYKKKGVLVDFSVWTVKDIPTENLYGGYQIPGYKYKNKEAGKYRVWSVLLPPLTGLTSKEINGAKINIPSNSEEILAALYGESWRKPDPNFVPDRSEIEVEYVVTYHRKPLLQVLNKKG